MQMNPKTENKNDCSPREVRQRAQKSQIQAAVAAGVSEPLVRLYEANQDAVTDSRKRAQLDRVYAGFAERNKGEA
jgi:hypothetical protein